MQNNQGGQNGQLTDEQKQLFQLLTQTMHLFKREAYADRGYECYHEIIAQLSAIDAQQCPAHLRSICDMIQGEGAFAIYEQLDHLLLNAQKMAKTEEDTFDEGMETLQALRNAFLNAYLVQLCASWEKVSEQQ